MILVGNQRGGARNLANHLLSPENEHVEVYEVRGFASDDLHGAFHEAYAMSKGTRCKQFLFSLSFNPPANERVSTADFEDAITRAETKLGLTDQPRAIVFHEKEGRRHAHVVWSRIVAEDMKAVQLSFSHRKLNEVSKELYLEHGWTMPKGYTDKSLSDPKNFSLDEWQQAKRAGKDPRAIKTALSDAWAVSDSRAALEHALKERGFTLARGDRRGFVALDRHGEIYALPKWAGVKTKDVRQRLGDPKELLSVDEAKARIADDMQPAMARLQGELSAREKQRQEFFEERKKELVSRQRAERKALFDKIEARRLEDAKERQERFRSGLGGLWDRLSGEHRRVREQNEREAYEAMQRERARKDEFILAQLEQRRQFEAMRKREEQRLETQKRELAEDTQGYEAMRPEAESQEDQKKAFIEKRKASEEQARSSQDRFNGPER